MGELVFGYKSCYDGWLLNGGNCDINPCSGYNFTSAPSSSIGTVASCKSGDNMKYKYSSCNNGWDLSNGACNVHPCSTTTYPYSSNPGSTAGTVTTCKSGTTTRYGYSKCNSGWTKSGGQCIQQLCSGYNSSNSSISGCSSTASCKDADGTHYKCTSCSSGYSLSSGWCYKLDNNCSGLSRIPANAVSYRTCIGEDTGKAYYCATACPSGSCDWCQPGEGHGKWFKSGCVCDCGWDGTGMNVCMGGGGLE